MTCLHKAGIKLSQTTAKNRSTTHEDCVQHHDQLFTSQPEVKQYVRRYVQKHPTKDKALAGRDHLADVDGIIEIFFDNMAGLNAVFQSENHKSNIIPDEEKSLTVIAHVPAAFSCALAAAPASGEERA